MMTDVLRQGRYRIERPLGTGAMGTVVLGRDTVLDRPVAIKLLADHLAADEAFRQRFLREARLAARLCHPNVVQVFDAGDDGRPFLVMEYVEGETVADLVARGRRFSADELLSLAAGLAAGLAQAHALGVVHRDVKPHNVLITGEGVAKLTDFGIARALEDAGLTEIGTVLGTAPFMAPEQAAGHPVGPPADVFGLAALLRYAAGADGRLPPALEPLVNAASAQDPAARPTAADFHQRLSALDSAPTQVAVPAPTRIAPVEVDITGPPARRRWPRPAVAALAALALVILLLALLPRGGDDDGSVSSSPTVAPVPEATNAAEAARNLAGWLRQQSG